jgi:macrolide transport system ATP-binding/permease protein
MLRVLLPRIRALFTRRRDESRLRREVNEHLELLAAEHVRHGLSPDAAREAARRDFGGVESMKDRYRDERRFNWLDNFTRDLRFGLRMVARRPGLLVVLVLTMALGIGINTAVFGLMRVLILSPLPVPEPDRIVFVTATDFQVHSIPNYIDLRDRNTTFSQLVAYRPSPMALETPDGARHVSGSLATGNYFEALGVRPIRGRFFTAADEAGPGSAPVAVLGFGFWNNTFRGDDAIVGREIRINGFPFTVIGVAPPGFRGMDLFYKGDLWVPMAMQQQIVGRLTLGVRGIRNSNRVFGRLRPGVTHEQAEADVNRVAAALVREYPEDNARLGYSVGRAGSSSDHTRGAAVRIVTSIFAFAGLVLLAVCVNLTSVLGARALERVPELATRASLGASRGRLIGQLVVETMLVCAAGCGAGLLVTAVLLRLMAALFDMPGLPVAFAVRLDTVAMGFAALLCLLTLAIGVTLPARQVWRSDPQLLLGRDTGRVTSRHTVRDLLLGVQVAMCCLLVAGCLTSLRGLQRSLAVPLGFDPDGVTIATFDLAQAGYSPDEGRAFQARALQAVAALPGVTEAAYAHSLPLTQIDQSSRFVYPEGTVEFGAATAINAQYFHVSPGYFAFMRTRLIAGREYTELDGPGQRRTVVNETFARRVIAVANAAQAVGKTFRINADAGPIEIIGVAEDGKYVSLHEEPHPVLFPAAMGAYQALTTIAVRSALPDEEVLAQVRNVVRRMDPRIPLRLEGRLTEALGFAFLPARAAATALTAFGVLAIVIAVLGIYGVAAYTISGRTREIGIRMAMGARPGQVIAGVLRSPIVTLCAGAAAGIVASIAAGRLLTTIVTNATTTEPIVLAGTVSAMMLAAGAAGWKPARRALTLDPARTLRES